MKYKIFAVAFLFIFVVGAQAQTTKKVPTPASEKSRIFRAETGYGQMFRYGNYSVTSPYHVVRIGGNVEFPIRYGIGIETGLKYCYAGGGRTQLYAHSDTAKFKYYGHSLDVPVRVTYTLPIFWGMKIFGYAGPNFNIGLAQSQAVTLQKHTVTPAPTHPLDYPAAGTYNLYQTELNPFSVQLGAGGGLQWKNYRIKSGYEWGLNNISKSKSYPQHIKGWYVAFEYEF